MNADRFWTLVRKANEGCWLWTGSSTGPQRARYGNLQFNGSIQKAHRVSWQISNGPIPVGMRVLHRCDVPLCVRPDHLFLGTLSDNARDCYLKNRSPIFEAIRVRARQQQAQKRCKRRHLLNASNVYVRPDNGRQCRKCQRLREQKSLARKPLRRQ